MGVETYDNSINQPEENQIKVESRDRDEDTRTSSSGDPPAQLVENKDKTFRLVSPSVGGLPTSRRILIRVNQFPHNRLKNRENTFPLVDKWSAIRLQGCRTLGARFQVLRLIGLFGVVGHH